MKKRIKSLLLLLFAVVLVLCIAAAAGSRDAYADTINVTQDGVWLSELLEEGLSEDDTLYFTCDSTLVIDADCTIKYLDGNNKMLYVEDRGAYVLTVTDGVSMGTNGTMQMQSGTIRITGIAANNTAFYGYDLIINDGKLQIDVDDEDLDYGVHIKNELKMPGGRLIINAVASNTRVYGLNSYKIDLNGGYIDCTIENDLGQTYGVYSEYSIQAKKGKLNVTAKKTGDGTYGWAHGIWTPALSIDRANVSSKVNASKVAAYGVSAKQLDIAGGRLHAEAWTQAEDSNSIGIASLTPNTGNASAAWTISGGTVNALGIASNNGFDTNQRGIGIMPSYSSDSNLTITGGIIYAGGTYCGIYVHRSVTLSIGGFAEVTAHSLQNGSGLYTKTALSIGDNAHVSTYSAQFNGIKTDSTLTITDKASVDAKGAGVSSDNKCAIYAAGGITFGSKQRIMYPEGGTIGSSGKIIIDADNYRAVDVTIDWVDPLPAKDISIDGSRFNASAAWYTYKNDEGIIIVNPNTMIWNAWYDPDTGILHLKDYDGGTIRIYDSTNKKLIIDLQGTNKIDIGNQFGIDADKNDLEITSSSGGTLEITGATGSTASGAAITVQWSNPSRNNSVTISGNASIYTNNISNKEMDGIGAGTAIVIRDRANVDINATFGSGATSDSYGLIAYQNVIISTSGRVNVSVKANDYWSSHEYGLPLGLYRGTSDALQIANAEYVSFSVTGGKARKLGTYDFAENVQAQFENGGDYYGFDGYRSTTRDTDAVLLTNNNGVVPLNGAIFPDQDFRTLVSDLFDTNKDGLLSSSEINNATEIDYNENYPVLYSVKGIEYLHDLKSFEWNYDPIRTLDLSRNHELQSVFAYDDDIEELYVDGCPKLKHLDVRANELTGIDVTGCPELQTLCISFNTGLTAVDLSGCPDLDYFEAEDDESITSFDFSNNGKMKHLDVNACDLSSLDVSNMPDLEYLECGSNSLSMLDVSSNSKLEYLYCHYNDLVELKLGSKPVLNELYCHKNNIDILDLSGAPNIKYAYYNDQPGTVTTNYVSYEAGGYNLRMDSGTDLYAAIAVLKAANLTLEGKISINFKVASEVEGLKVRFYYEKNGYAQVKEMTLDSSTFVSDPNGDYYLVSYNQIPAKEMTETLRIKLYDAEGNQGVFKISSGYIDQYDYSVSKWCNNKINQNNNANDVMIAKALLNYGHYTQLALKYNDGLNGRPNKLANPNGYLSAEMANFAGGNSEYDSVTTGGPALGAKAFALVLESDTSIKLKLKRNVSVKIDNVSVVPQAEVDSDGSNIWAVYKTGIPAKKLHEKSSFKLTEGSSSVTLQYGALSWANKKLTGSDVNDKNLAKAMYLYNYAARKYFNYDAAGL